VRQVPNAIIFNSINVNTYRTNAGIFVGEISAPGWDSHNKNQYSIGFINAAFASGSYFPGNLNVLSDNDFIDTAIQDGFEREGGPSVQG
jgi:hypothetical protein